MLIITPLCMKKKKKQDTLIFSKCETDKLDDTTLTTEMNTVLINMKNKKLFA